MITPDELRAQARTDQNPSGGDGYYRPLFSMRGAIARALGFTDELSHLPWRNGLVNRVHRRLWDEGYEVVPRKKPQRFSDLYPPADKIIFGPKPEPVPLGTRLYVNQPKGLSVRNGDYVVIEGDKMWVRRRGLVGKLLWLLHIRRGVPLSKQWDQS